MKKILAVSMIFLIMFSLVGCTVGIPTDSNAPYIEDGYWYIDGTNTGIKAEGVDGADGKDGINGTNGKDGADGKDGIDGTNGKDGADGKDGIDGTNGKDGATWICGTTVPTTEGNLGDFYLNTSTYDIYKREEFGWKKIGNIKGTDATAESDSEKLGDHYMISNGLTDMAANAVEFIVDDNTGIVYAVYLASETSLGESSALVKMAKFNIMQPTNVQWITVFDKSADFKGSALSECNIINLNSTTVRVFAVNMSNWTYYYKDVNKKTMTVSALKEVKFKSDANSEAVAFSKENLNNLIASFGGTLFSQLQSTTKILEHNGYYYTTVVGGNRTKNVLFMRSVDGSVWEFQSVINHSANYEAMLEYHDGKFWVMCRNGSESYTTDTQQNLMYSEDGINWTQSNLALTTSDTRPYLFTYQGDLYLAYSSPMESDYSTIRTWRCNIHIGKIVSSNGMETFDELIYKESKFGIVYYALCDWYGKMVMLYSSGELNPTEGLMGGWSQGKDCVNYTVIHQQTPILSFKSLSSISVASKPTITEYAVGDSFVPDGLIVRAEYSDNTLANITNYSLSIPDMTTPGTKKVVVSYSYNGVTRTTSFDITVSEVEKNLESIEITSLPKKCKYVLNEVFIDTGLIVTARYNIGSSSVITDYALSVPDMTTLGIKTVTVTYTEGGVTKVAFFDIEVLEEAESVYTQLQSIKSNGSQYIETGYKTTQNTKIIISMEMPDDSSVEGGRWLFNSTNASVSKNYGFCIHTGGAYVLDYGGIRYTQGAINWKDGKNVITIGNGEFTINGGELASGLNVTTSASDSLGTLRLFTSASSKAMLPATVFEIQVYEGDTLVMHLIPARRNEDGRIGFYDLVSEKFVFSATSTDFES